MIKLYTIAKKKTGILGLWQDKEGKVYRDKIDIKNLDYVQFSVEGNKLFLSGEKAIFYILDNTAYIESVNGEKEILKHCITWQENKLRPSLVKALLVQHGGLTIFKNENDYTIQIWKG